MKLGTLLAFLLFPFTSFSSPQCNDLITNQKQLWRDDLSRFFSVSGPTGAEVHRVLDKARVRVEQEFYPAFFSSLEIAKQEVLQLELLGKLLWRLRSPLKTAKVLRLAESNVFEINEVYVNPETDALITQSHMSPTIVLDLDDGVRLIDVIEWLNGEISKPASWLEKDAAKESIQQFNIYLLEFQSSLERFARDTLVKNSSEIDVVSEVKVYNLDITLVNQKSLLPKGEAFISITPSNVVLTSDGSFVIFSPL